MNIETLPTAARNVVARTYHVLTSADTATADAQRLIDQSRHTTSIVHAPYSPSLADALDRVAESNVANGTVYETWGEGWRVHLDGYPEPDNYEP